MVSLVSKNTNLAILVPADDVEHQPEVIPQALGGLPRLCREKAIHQPGQLFQQLPLLVAYIVI